MKPCFGYIRVSTQKQGEGVSLEAQKDAILAFAARNDLTVTRWFEEKETAAKSGRPVFTSMLKNLKQGSADGVIIHKIDRSARNLRDWALFSELPDVGVSVYVATESLDFNTRGGRLTADIQAVIAADYIRNLREECIKGLNGRLKQGLYPFRAPLGYLDEGGGKPKTICPKTGPLVRLAFELYSTREYSYQALLKELESRGLRNVRGGQLTLSGLGKLLQNPFYMGLVHIKTTGKTYKGVHEPLVSAATWKRVQTVRGSRCGPKQTKHGHLFRGLFSCAYCEKLLVPELQKGNVYYRCKRKGCPTKTIREDRLDQAIRQQLARLTLSPAAAQKAEGLEPGLVADISRQRDALCLQIKDEEARIDRLEDLLIDDTIDADLYHKKRGQSLERLAQLEEHRLNLPDPAALSAHHAKLAELRSSLVLLYEMANHDERRQIVENIWPNRMVRGKEPLFEPYSWVQSPKSDEALSYGAPQRDACRTLIDLLDQYRDQLILDSKEGRDDQ